METNGGGWTLLQKMSSTDACIPAWNLGATNTLPNPNGSHTYTAGNLSWTNTLQAREVRGSVMAGALNGSTTSISVNGTQYNASMNAVGDPSPCN